MCASHVHMGGEREDLSFLVKVWDEVDFVPPVAFREQCIVWSVV